MIALTPRLSASLVVYGEAKRGKPNMRHAGREVEKLRPVQPEFFTQDYWSGLAVFKREY